MGIALGEQLTLQVDLESIANTVYLIAHEWEFSPRAVLDSAPRIGDGEVAVVRPQVETPN